MSSSAHAQQRVLVTNLKLYAEDADSFTIDIPGLRYPPAPFGGGKRPVQIPRMMIEEIHLTPDRTRVAMAIMELWVAEQNGFEYMLINESENGQPAAQHSDSQQNLSV